MRRRMACRIRLKRRIGAENCSTNRLLMQAWADYCRSVEQRGCAFSHWQCGD